MRFFFLVGRARDSITIHAARAQRTSPNCRGTPNGSPPIGNRRTVPGVLIPAIGVCHSVRPGVPIPDLGVCHIRCNGAPIVARMKISASGLYSILVIRILFSASSAPSVVPVAPIPSWCVPPIVFATWRTRSRDRGFDWGAACLVARWRTYCRVGPFLSFWLRDLWF